MSLIERIDAQFRAGVDPTKFERAAVAALRAIYPGLVPVEAGRDRGRDGDIYFLDGQDNAARGRLLATTGDPLANLKRSHKRWVDEGLGTEAFQVDVIAIACSLDVTGTTRKNIDAFCRGQGLPIPTIFGRDWFVERLAQNSAWLEYLTGIRARLESLRRSSGARSGLVERDEELASLLDLAAKGDVVVTGIPGVGKTRLLQALEDAWFVEPLAHEHLAADLLRTGAGVVVLDDAQLHQDVLGALVRLRLQEGLSFVIVATTWPDAATIVAATLPEGSRLCVEPMRQAAIDRIIVGQGVKGVRARHEIIRQSRGRPGWAVTLAQSMVDGDGQAVVSGRILVGQVNRFLEQRALSRTAMDVLAHVAAIGAVSAADVELIGTSVGIPASEASGLVELMATAGLLERVHGVWRVQPALRALIVSRWFFGPSPRRSWTMISNSFEHRSQDLVSALLDAARIDPDASILAAADAWADGLGPASQWGPITFDHLTAYAMCDQRRAELAVSCVLAPSPAPTPGPAVPSAPAMRAEQGPAEVLRACVRRYFLPSAVCALLDSAVGDLRTEHNTPDHPMRVLRETVCQIDPDGISLFELRGRLISIATEWLGPRRDQACWETAAIAMRVAMSPEVEGTWSDPSQAWALTLARGVEPASHLTQLGEEWARVAAALLPEQVDPPPVVLDQLIEVAQDWLRVAARSRAGQSEANPEQHAASSAVAWRVLASLVPFLRRQSGPALRAAQLLDRAEAWDIERGSPGFEPIAVDEDLALFAGRREPGTDVEAWLRKRDQDGLAIAGRLDLLGPEAGTGRYRELRQAATPTSGYSDSQRIAWQLSRIVADPSEWVGPAVRGIEPGLAGAMLSRTLEHGDYPDSDLLLAALADGRLRGAVVRAALTSSSLWPSVQAVFQRLGPDDVWLLDGLGIKEHADDVLLALLTHPVRAIRAATSLAFDVGTRRGPELPPDWIEHWTAAFLDAEATVISNQMEWDLEESLKALATTQPSTLVLWVERRVSEGTTRRIPGPDRLEVCTAILTLDRASRLSILRSCVSDPRARRDLLPSAVGADATLLTEALQGKLLGIEEALNCLTGAYDDAARVLIPVLIRAGAAPARIAGVVGGFGTYTGNQSDEHARGIEWWTTLANDEPDTAEAATLAVAYLSQEREQALRREREEAVLGLG